MIQRIKAGNFYLDVSTDGTSLVNHFGEQKKLIAEKPDTPEPLEPQPYIYRPNDPFQSSIDKIVAIGSLAPTHKPWVKKTWLYLFVIFPLIPMELFALSLKFGPNGGWAGFLLMQVHTLAYGIVSYCVWLNKTLGPPARKS